MGMLGGDEGDEGLPQGGSTALYIGEISPKREINFFLKVDYQKLTKLREKI